jgi:hypothetical protein
MIGANQLNAVRLTLAQPQPESQGKGASEIGRLLGIGQASVYRATRTG